MIAQATPAARPLGTPGTPSMVGNRVPLPHRFHMSDGRTIVGDLHKAPSARLADHLSTLKGYVSVTNACCEGSGTHFPYIAVNQANILFIEELAAPADTVKVTTPGGVGHVPR
jgi:hypothetical protein